MLKKLIATGAAFGLVMASASGASATGGWNWMDWFSNDFEVKVHNEDLTVQTSSMAVADTGSNEQEIEGSSSEGWNWMTMFHEGGDSDSMPEQRMDTGDAYAKSDVFVNVASTLMPLCDCLDFDGDMKVHVWNDDLTVQTESMAAAYTGDNEQEIESGDSKHHSNNYMTLRGGDNGWSWPSMGGSTSGYQDMDTGDAESHSYVDVFVGYTDFGVRD